MKDRKPIKLPIWLVITVGTMWVNIPVLPIMFIPMILSTLWLQQSDSTLLIVLFIVPAFFVGFVLAWSWWSWNVPKWRLWAYRRVNNIETLKSWAVAVGLIWPDGHLFERTEIRSHKVDREIKEREGRKP